MWLNHFSREQQAINKRTDRYALNTQMIINNPDKFGSEYNNLSESKKRHMQTMFIQNG